MMKKLPLLTLIALSVVTQSLRAQETRVSNAGQAAVASREAATKWYIVTTAGATALVAFGLITFLASTDPVTYTHRH